MYRAKVKAKASAKLIRELMIATDKAAEIQNTLRIGIPVKLTEIETEEAG